MSTTPTRSGRRALIRRPVPTSLAALCVIAGAGLATHSAVGQTASSESSVSVSDNAQLQAALDAARPGTTITLRDGVYHGGVTVRRSGTEEQPITVTGGRGAILDGGAKAGGYVVHLDKANHVDLTGFSIRGGTKDVVFDESTHNRLSDLDISNAATELVALRNFSSDNELRGNDIHGAGLSSPGFGEGVYIGLASSNWNSPSQSRTGGKPDRSDRNTVADNTISDTTAESVDLKEGTSDGTISNNTFNSRGMSGTNFADSWLDVQGNGYHITGNHGTNPGGGLVDGYQTHVILPGWGRSNVFSGNISSVNATGYGVHVQSSGPGNVVTDDNQTTGARLGLSNLLNLGQ